MWNFNYLIPSIMIISVFVGYYVSLPRLPVRKNLVFIYVVSLECLVMISDLFSTWADINHQSFPSWALYVLNSSYFIFFLSRAFAFYIFTASVLKIDLFASKIQQFCINLPVDLGIIIVLLAPWTKWFYYIDESGYHSGPLYNLLYPIFAFYLTLSFITLIKQRNRLVRKREKYIILWYNVILTIGLIVRYAFPKYLLMDIFCLMAMIVIYLSFENPDGYLEERTYIFNRAALRDYIIEINGQKPINALIFCVHNYIDSTELYGIQQMNQGVYLIENYLKKEFPDYLIFDYRNARFVMFSKEDVDWHQIYDKIQERFLSPWVSKDTELYLDVGASIVNLSAKALPYEVLLRVFSDGFIQADKTVGNDINIYDDDFAAGILAESGIKRALDKAIENDAVEVFLQPIVDSATGKLAGAEALARIRGNDGKIIPPGLFIPIAEKNGKINQLGKQVFRKCCQFVKSSGFKNTGLTFINVNISPIQFMRLDLYETLTKMIEDANITPDLIHLEITEESMIDELLMEKQIETLTNKGFKFVLDDYGKGYSNMARLHRTPFINIKLDMSIVWDYCNNPDAILPNEVSAFTTTGFTITAEGIEDEDMARKMREIGCTYLQGYYYSRPLPIKEFIEKYSCQ
ncbi:EAL domain, c-di-GMP-specific phosphodiesterase class I (or its enzymatically inactive variant) [Pseudobutyrivibrio sp. YE44]|uniref:EAL domain-containing protein n=1 Tax=Pseudobutyrivibrio sp. YE44 TaxID=1520802 RepID=UPI00088D21DC|nr:EAL domain-containing protein [Pseudobutyrivibrio sp. YE44]SDB45418.1 EAL domain, c-di-GMP-specific phosphodiesterase class I (or its enzymatically inactive variant) [Pseudobutyrivibrio sp. YE44]